MQHDMTQMGYSANCFLSRDALNNMIYNFVTNYNLTKCTTRAVFLSMDEKYP